MVPVMTDGTTVKLATIHYKPAGPGPFPTVISTTARLSKALDGHRIGSAPSLWGATLEACLAEQGLPARVQ